jgi:hypothetical protein
VADHPSEQVDRVAEAIAHAFIGPNRIVWRYLTEADQNRYRKLALAALDAATPPPGGRFDCDRCGVNVAYHSAACIMAVGERDQPPRGVSEYPPDNGALQ